MRIKNLLSVAFIAAICLQGRGVSAQNVVVTPVPFTRWEPIPEVNILWKKRVWRELEAKDNKALFATVTKEGNGSKALIDVLLDGIKDGTIQAYSPINDRFTDKLSYETIKAQLDAQVFVTKTTDPETGEEIASCAGGNMSGAVHQFKLKEDWLFLNDKKKMVVRILGFAPVVTVIDETGTTVEKPLFWVFYPDYREYFASYFVPAAGNVAPTWDEFFEVRQFNSKVTRVVETSYQDRQK